jgi:predicted O-linked N-acetylglucosamine transferase (SPINDLY family)
MLDTPHFGGGNTTYEALAIGTPIVTLPSAFLRGRTTYACYQKMGIRDCIAENSPHYVDIALRLGTNSAYREQIKAQLLATHSILYEDITVIRELEQFLLSTLKEKS